MLYNPDLVKLLVTHQSRLQAFGNDLNSDHFAKDCGMSRNNWDCKD
jgi:hypothetical protein